ncbi:MAG: GumC family protein, partial [Thermoanaerobaculia bacterium]
MILDADKPPTADVHALNLHEYWRIVVKRKWLIAIVVVASLAVAFFASILTTPTYKATVLLAVERERASAFDIGNAIPAAGYDPEFLPTQTRLMQSREVAERVVRRLNLAANPQTSTQSTGFLASLFGGGSDEPKEDAGLVEPSAITAAARNIQAGIETRPVRGTTLIELSYVSADPRLAADVTNALAEAYIDWNLESKFQVVGQASRFLSTQIEQLKTEIETKERELLAYGAETDIVSVDPQTNITLQKLESLNRDYAQAVGDRVTKEARYYELQNARPESIADTLSAGVVSQLRAEVSRLEREYADKLNLYKPEWPAMQQLKSQIDKGKQNLAEAIDETVTKARDNARTEYLAARRREQSLVAVLQGQKQEAMTLNSNAVEYNNLRTEVETRRALLDNLMEQQAETEVASRLRGERVSNIRIVDAALPPTYRFRPSYRSNATRGLLFGLAIGLG